MIGVETSSSYLPGAIDVTGWPASFTTVNVHWFVYWTYSVGSGTGCVERVASASGTRIAAANTSPTSSFEKRRSAAIPTSLHAMYQGTGWIGVRPRSMRRNDEEVALLARKERVEE